MDLATPSHGLIGIKSVLDEAYETYHNVGFIDNDPILVPRQYSQREDIEIVAFWTAILSWGQRKTIINKCLDLFGRMGQSPFDYIMNLEESDLSAFDDFKHRTFQPEDTKHFLRFFKWLYEKHSSLEQLFVHPSGSLEDGINQFHNAFFDASLSPLQRTRKHVAAPLKKSTCKRINMFLRWMVRKGPVDFGLWQRLHSRQLFIPYDVHVERVARELGLVSSTTKNWKTVVQLTEVLRGMDPDDPIKYDFALFGIGVNEKDHLL